LGKKAPRKVHFVEKLTYVPQKACFKMMRIEKRILGKETDRLSFLITVKKLCFIKAR